MATVPFGGRFSRIGRSTRNFARRGRMAGPVNKGGIFQVAPNGRTSRVSNSYAARYGQGRTNRAIGRGRTGLGRIRNRVAPGFSALRVEGASRTEAAFRVARGRVQATKMRVAARQAIFRRNLGVKTNTGGFAKIAGRSVFAGAVAGGATYGIFRTTAAINRRNNPRAARIHKQNKAKAKARRQQRRMTKRGTVKTKSQLNNGRQGKKPSWARRHIRVRRDAKGRFAGSY